MAAPRGSVSDSESSEDGDAEELQRCQEAAVPAWGWGPRPKREQEVSAQDILPAARPSLRQKVDEHEQDGNELQTTPEFRVHVAKKLGALLDSYITISESSPRPAQVPVQTAPGEDDGFRLFFTSVPGSPKGAGLPTTSRKRPPSSSSESDSDEEWRRCQEAAVSATDILRHRAWPVQEAPAEQQAPKKKKKKKQEHKQVEQEKDAGPRVTTEKQPRPPSLHREPEAGGVPHNGGHAQLPTKRKKRRKKQQKEREAPPFPAQKGQAARAAQ
ncbi:protein CUSTOS isoform X2 [Dromiciops gliroides]|uniref:protein CUSTOS isoform X2 n=1 Tax=Dromiciops gliroides TaxID=33562 RepID=UPI001CC448DE|nr:protein CUSTOS isoform X2 [Dromiciops gliroides]